MPGASPSGQVWESPPPRADTRLRRNNDMSAIAADRPRHTFQLKSFFVGVVVMVGKVESSSTIPITQIVGRQPLQTPCRFSISWLFTSISVWKFYLLWTILWKKSHQLSVELPASCVGYQAYRMQLFHVLSPVDCQDNRPLLKTKF